MNILWITWKDMGHPEAGGAEVVCSELCKRLLADGHSVTLLTSGYPNATPDGHVPGVKIIRAGSSRYLHPSHALFYYIRNLRNKYDILIEEVQGGAPYFSTLFERKARRFLLYHQLGRKNWLYEIKAPFSYLGYYVLVPLATRIIGLSKVPVITVSESTRQELAKHGLRTQRTSIISEGIQLQPLTNLTEVKKYSDPTILSHGSMRVMKRTIDQIKAFELAKKQIPNLKMKISGSSNSQYGKKVLAYIKTSPYSKDIEYVGRTTDEQKIELMQRCHAIVVTSVEEGWGLIVTEANSQGTPAVVYDVDGLRDSVQNTTTGITTAPNPTALADGLLSLLESPRLYETIRKNAWQWSKQFTFQQSYIDLQKVWGLQ